MAAGRVRRDAHRPILRANEARSIGAAAARRRGFAASRRAVGPDAGPRRGRDDDGVLMPRRLLVQQPAPTARVRPSRSEGRAARIALVVVELVVAVGAIYGGMGCW